MTDKTPLIEALAGIYPALNQHQVLDLAATVERLALRALMAPPWLSATLKRYRTAADLTQMQVAARMDWSPSKVIRIENGTNGVSHNDLLALIELYRIRDADVVKRLVDEAFGRRRAIRQPGRPPLPLRPGTAVEVTDAGRKSVMGAAEIMEG